MGLLLYGLHLVGGKGGVWEVRHGYRFHTPLEGVKITCTGEIVRVLVSGSRPFV